MNFSFLRIALRGGRVMAGVLALWLCGVGWAWGVAPKLANILPVGGQRGTEVEVRLVGQRLEDTREIVFYRSGISAVSFKAETNVVRATLRIDAGCALGEHPMRLRTATGISELRTFWISALTNLAEIEPNHEPSSPQRVPLNVTLLGTIPSEDIDRFIVRAEKGQRLTAEVDGMRLGRGAFDPHVAIYDRRGRELAAADDTALLSQDAVASILVPETGDYIVEVRETSFAGRDDYYYRLHVGTFPRPLAVYPLAVKAGQPAHVRFIGDVKGDFEEGFPSSALPAGDRTAVFAGSSASDAGDGAAVSPSPNWVRVTASDTFSEAEPNDTREQAGAVREVPVTFNGILNRMGDQDWHRFHAKKGQNLQVSVLARRLRSPVDSMIQIVNAKGSPVAENDDAAGPDSGLNFKVDEDGDYTILVRDHLRRGGPGFVYCVEIAPVAPGLSLKIPEVARNDTQSRQYIAVPRGNRFATLLSVKRANVAGDLAVIAGALPAGVRMLAESVPAKVDQFPVVFEAETNAAVDGKRVELSVRSTNGLSAAFQNDVELVQGPNNTSYYSTRVDGLPVAVTEPAPFRVRLMEPKVPLVQGGSMELGVIVDRDAGFEEPIQVRLLWNPPGVTSLPDMTIPKGTNQVRYVLNAKADADLRAWPLVVTGAAKVRDGELFVSSSPARLTVAEPFLVATMEKVSCEPGRATNIVVKLEQKIPFDGRASVRLLGLSDKVSVAPQTITKDDREVVFPVKVEAGCSLGSQRNLFCSVDIPKDGEVIPHHVAQGSSFRVVPPKKPENALETKKVARKP